MRKHHAVDPPVNAENTRPRCRPPPPPTAKSDVKAGVMQDPWGELNPIVATAKSQVAKVQASPKAFVATASKAATLPSAAKDEPSMSAPDLDPECANMPPLVSDESDDDDRKWSRRVAARAQQSAAHIQATKAQKRTAAKAVSAATPNFAFSSAAKRKSSMSAPDLDTECADMPPLTGDDSDDNGPRVHSPAQAA